MPAPATVTRYEHLAAELDSLLHEDGAALKPGQSMWQDGGSATPKPAASPASPKPGAPAPAGGGRCPDGQRKDPHSGKCAPREQLRTRYRAHEPNAAMHREKHLHHATMAANLRAQGNHEMADKHERRAAGHLKQAQWHTGQMQSLHKVLYPHRYRPKTGANAPATGKVQEIPMVQKPITPARFGGQAWGGHSGPPGTSKGAKPTQLGAPGAARPPAPHPGAKPPGSPHQGHGPGGSTPGFNPFGQTQPAPQHPGVQHPGVQHPGVHHGAHPGSASGAPDSAHAPTEPGKPPSILHRLGTAALHGFGHAAAQRAHTTGSLGWSALAHGLSHLAGIGGSPAVQAPPTGHDPTVQSPQVPPPGQPPKKKKPANLPPTRSGTMA